MSEVTLALKKGPRLSTATGTCTPRPVADLERCARAFVPGPDAMEREERELVLDWIS